MSKTANSVQSSREPSKIGTGETGFNNSVRSNCVSEVCEEAEAEKVLLVVLVLDVAGQEVEDG